MSAPCLLATQQEAIASYLQAQLDWRREDYDLEPLAEWDQERLPIVLAVPKAMICEPTPMFALLRDGTVVAPRQAGAVGRLLRAAFALPKPEDAVAVARLATWFGDFGTRVGRLWTRPMDRRVSAARLPREEAAPALRVEGDTVTVEFYCYDDDALSFFDCRLSRTGEDVSLTARRV